MSSESGRGSAPTTDPTDTASLTAADFEWAAYSRSKSALPELDDVAFFAGLNLVRAAASLVQVSEERVHRPLGWSWAGFRVMYIIWILGEAEARSISRLAGVTRQTTSSVLATLERDGLVARTRSMIDRRLVGVTLTERGEEGVRTALNAQNRLTAERLGGLDRQELEQLGALLRKALLHD